MACNKKHVKPVKKKLKKKAHTKPKPKPKKPTGPTVYV
jgi:hypothetical protein